MQFRLRPFLIAFYFIISPLLILSYLLEPFTEDVRVYLGAAKVTALTPGFPATLDSVWESRQIGHRFLFYCLNLIDPFDGWMYSIWMKLVVAVITIVILYFFSKAVSTKMHISFHYPFALGLVGLFAINNFIIFSSEYFSVLIAMVMLTWLLSENNLLWVAAGLLTIPIALLKGLPVMLVFIVAIAVILLTPLYTKRLLFACSAIPGAGMAVLAILISYFPHTLSDLYLTFKIARITRLDWLPTAQYFFKYAIGVIGFAPLIVIAACSLFFIVALFERPDMRDSRVRDLKLIVLMWLVACAYVLIIQEFFYYHYYLMLIPALITLCYFLSISPDHEKAFAAVIVICLVIYAAVVAGWSAGLAFKGYSYWSDRERVADEINSWFDVTDQPSTLYLDQSGAYFFPTQSACRYVAALPYQRHMPDWDMSMLPQYWEMRNCALSYTGKYIVVEHKWFNLSVSTHKEMADKLSTEYKKVYFSPYYDLYQKRLRD